MSIFGFLKNDKLEVATQDEHISVSNLKDYVVQGYEKEKQLNAQLLMQAKTIDELYEKLAEKDSLLVILEKKESDISSLELKNSKLEHRLLEIDKLTDENNTLAIKLKTARDLIDKQESNSRQATQVVLGKYTTDLIEQLTVSFKYHKGNLSKAIAIEVAKDCIYKSAKNIENKLLAEGENNGKE